MSWIWSVSCFVSSTVLHHDQYVVSTLWLTWWLDTSIFLFFLKCAVTRIRTWVIAATTQCTNHYTITAVRNSNIKFQGVSCFVYLCCYFVFWIFSPKNRFPGDAQLSIAVLNKIWQNLTLLSWWHVRARGFTIFLNRDHYAIEIHIFRWGYSSVVEHSTADREVHGSTPCAPFEKSFSC